jgi:LacI family transcriptional regulator
VGDTSLPWFRRRYQGCLEELQSRGAELGLIEDIAEDGSIQYGYEAALRLVRSGAACDAVFAGNDAIAYGVWKALDEHGIGIPDEVAVVGFDDREFCSLTSPNLSSVQTFNERVGRECARVLLEKLKDPDRRIPQVKLPTSLVVRGSSARGLE